MTEHIDRVDLLNRIRNEYGRLDALLARLSDADMSEPGADGDWSVKDILAHLADWQDYLANRIALAQRGEQPARRASDSEAELERLNAEIHRRTRDSSLHDVRLAFHKSYRDVMDALEQLSDADLARGSRFHTLMGDPFLEHIAGNTYEHYQEHMDAIQRWADRHGTSDGTAADEGQQ